MTYHPFEIVGADRPERWLVTCDHAANTVPPFVNGGTLGLPEEEMGRHIAYDVGADGLSRELARLLNGPAILSNFSRLVIDPNRGEDDPTLLMKLYDGTIIPGNRYADEAEVQNRLNKCYRPYHTALAELAAKRADTVIVAVHSFTPQLKGYAPRPWHVGLLYAADTRLARPLADLLHAEPDLCVGENEPYGGHLPGDAIARHAIAYERPNILIELRNDLIRSPEQQAAWAARLAPMLQEAANRAGV
ncbi:N-formylglutamate amidohydrolase [Roseovarius faecimaris]|uniref:N-formylglutamate amidohydrolase n=1 Tax=Roseovarius faecimaris TaxID=2494550 RepID=A0A6I6IM26_9RHOB|nr:N-formylglutamate amidohydrolase [Roseovarius faecimaris]QGX96833.1 N-formylglutamate amidohydrolase [Roseovarius faecimaris]